MEQVVHPGGHDVDTGRPAEGQRRLERLNACHYEEDDDRQNAWRHQRDRDEEQRVQAIGAGD